MPQRASATLEPRKSPVQARSNASVDAILEGTIQVLLQVGKERLTTTRVAQRAGVSVGTLYQYFPNKSALLRGALKRHMDAVRDAVEMVCHEQKGRSLEAMTTALVTTFLKAKMSDGKAGVALYAVSSSVDGVNLVRELTLHLNQMIVAMLKTGREPLRTEPQMVASMLQGVMSGVSRRLLESADPEQQFDNFQRELVLLACAYVSASCVRL